MKFIIVAFFLYSCSQLDKKSSHPEDDLVTAGAALNQAQMSYLKGCIDAFHDLKLPKSFDACREKSIHHRQELIDILDQPPYQLR